MSGPRPELCAKACAVYDLALRTLIMSWGTVCHRLLEVHFVSLYPLCVFLLLALSVVFFVSSSLRCSHIDSSFTVAAAAEPARCGRPWTDCRFPMPGLTILCAFCSLSRGRIAATTALRSGRPIVARSAAGATPKRMLLNDILMVRTFASGHRNCNAAEGAKKFLGCSVSCPFKSSTYT